MLLSFCVSKIHRATVTDANLDYIGSITIDSLLVEAAGLFQGQEVVVNSLANGTSWKTYVLRGPEGKGDICLNGPPAHHFQKGDMVIILAYGFLDVAKDRLPTVVFVDGKNAITDVKNGSI